MSLENVTMAIRYLNGIGNTSGFARKVDRNDEKYHFETMKFLTWFRSLRSLIFFKIARDRSRTLLGITIDGGPLISKLRRSLRAFSKKLETAMAELAFLISIGCLKSTAWMEGSFKTNEPSCKSRMIKVSNFDLRVQSSKREKELSTAAKSSSLP